MLRLGRTLQFLDFREALDCLYQGRKQWTGAIERLFYADNPANRGFQEGR